MYLWNKSKRKKTAWYYLAIPAVAAFASYQAFKNSGKIKAMMQKYQERKSAGMDETEEEEF